MSETVQEIRGVIGAYEVEHKVVLPEYREEALWLCEEIRNTSDEGRVAELERRLIDLPRRSMGVEQVPNIVTDVGAKLLLDTTLAGAAYTATTYLGLKGSGSAAVGDTQASHAGWNELGNANAPTYSGARKTVSWSSASGTGGGSRIKSSSGTYTFTFTAATNATVDGLFLNINGSSAIDNTTGTLYSVGTFSAGAKTGINTSDTLTVSYSTAL
jgi:hypothetical protein